LEDDKFNLYKSILYRRLNKKYSTLADKSSLAWNEIYEDSLNFEYDKSVLPSLNKINLTNLVNFFSKYFIGQPKKLSIRLYKDPIKNISLTEENYGYLNNKIKSLVYSTTDFLSQAKTLHKRLSQY
jgi:secreted Zn-dependent insulinase-like peptidase